MVFTFSRSAAGEGSIECIAWFVLNGVEVIVIVEEMCSKMFRRNFYKITNVKFSVIHHLETYQQVPDDLRNFPVFVFSMLFKS